MSANNSKLFQFFETELQEIYWAENALVRAIPKMIGNASSQELKDALVHHLGETKEHVERLDEVFSIIGEDSRPRKCEAMNGLISEAWDIMDSCEKGAMMDAGIIAAGQKVEHYEIASYGTLRNYADTLGYADAVSVLEATLREEKNADKKLTEIAVSSVNENAAHEIAQA